MIVLLLTAGISTNYLVKGVSINLGINLFHLFKTRYTQLGVLCLVFDSGRIRYRLYGITKDVYGICISKGLSGMARYHLFVNIVRFGA